MKHISLTISALLCLLTGAAIADPGDVSMPDAVLEAAVEAIIGDDGVSGAVDGNWLVGDGASSAGPGQNDPDGLVELGSLDDMPNQLIVGVNDLTGLQAASNLEFLFLGAGDLTALAPIADLPSLLGAALVDMGIEDAHLAELAAGDASPVGLFLLNCGLGGVANAITTAGINFIGQIGSLVELGVMGTGNELDISALGGLSLGDAGLGLGLALDGNTIVDGFEVIGQFTGLRALSLGGTGITSNDLNLVDWSLMTVLEELLVPYNHITDISMLLDLGAPAGALIDLAMNPGNVSICNHVPALRDAGTRYGTTIFCPAVRPCSRLR